MKKDKEWLLERLVALGNEPVWGNEYFNDGMNAAFVSIGRLIDQLNEPEQVVCAENEHTIPTVSKKEIVVPQFVADYIRINKRNELGLWSVASRMNKLTSAFEGEAEKKFGEWIYGGDVDIDEMYRRQDLFSRAYITGNYTIEKPKLLTVIVKDYDKTIMSKQLPEDEVNKMMEGLE